MPDEINKPEQNEGSDQTTQKHPVNLAMIEAAQRGIDLKTPSINAPQPPATTSSEAEAHPANLDGPADKAMECLDPVQAAESLLALAEAASKGRLSAADEDRAVVSMRTCIAEQGAGTSAAIAAMRKLPWILGVRAIEQSWPTLTATARDELITGIAVEEAGDFIRLRLSVARSLVKFDARLGARLAASVCGAIWKQESASLSQMDSKLVGNVFIGRGKPWILQLSLDALEEGESLAVISCLVFSAFNINNPPITQLSILRYAGSRLNSLDARLLALVARHTGRWNGKWQAALKKELPELPPEISASLKNEEAPKEAKPNTGSQHHSNAQEAEKEDAEIPLPPELDEKLKLAIESGDHEAIEAITQEANTWREIQRVAEEKAQREKRAQRGGKARRSREKEREPQKNERPAYVSREQEAMAKAGSHFNLNQTLRQIENYVQQLRSDLSAAQARQKKPESPRRFSKLAPTATDPNLSMDELKLLVAQLEQRNADLQSRVEELLADSEARALATQADSDVTAQYRALLKLKLQEDYSDYLSLEAGTTDIIVQQHYRALVRHLFFILLGEGIALEGDLPPVPPPPLPPLPPAPEVDDEEEDDEELDRIEDEDENENASSDDEDESEEAVHEPGEEDDFEADDSPGETVELSPFQDEENEANKAEEKSGGVDEK